MKAVSWVLAVLCIGLGGCAQQPDAGSATVETSDSLGANTGQTIEAELLFVQEAEAVTFEEDTMTLVGATPRTLFFTDRPERIAGYLSFDEFINEVSAGSDSFADDPPNATLVSLEGDEFVDVVLVLTEAPALEDGNLVFSVQVTQGTPPASSGPAALFIDTVGRPLSPASAAGAHRRHRRRAIRRHN